MKRKRGGKPFINICVSLICFVIAFFYPVVSYAATKLHNLPPGTTITFSGRQWIVLDQKSDGTTYIILSANDGNRAFDPDNTHFFNPNDTNNIAYYLNNTFYNSLSQRHLIESHLWDIKYPNGTGTQSDVLAKIGLISYMEYNTYRSLLPPTGYNWWTRTPSSGYPQDVYFVKSDGTLVPGGAAGVIGVRPTLYLKAGTLVNDNNEVLNSVPPAAPQGLQAVPISPTQVKLSWQPNVESDLGGYIIYRDSVEIARVDANSTSYLDTGLTPSTTYTYTIRAFNIYNDVSDMSNSTVVTTPTLLPPQGVRAIAISYNQVELSWEPSTGEGLAGYIIYRDYVEIARVGPNENIYIDNTVSPNTRYTYGIKAYSTDGFISDISNAATVTTPASPHPVITVRVDGRTIKISWTGSGSGFSYKVLINDAQVANITKTSYDYSASGPGYYTVQIVAVSPSGEEFPSTKVGVSVSSIVSSYNMVTDVLQNTGAILLSTGGLLALYFGLKATPFLIEIVQTFIARRI